VFAAWNVCSMNRQHLELFVFDLYHTQKKACCVCVCVCVLHNNNNNNYYSYYYYCMWWWWWWCADTNLPVWCNVWFTGFAVTCGVNLRHPDCDTLFRHVTNASMLVYTRAVQMADYLTREECRVLLSELLQEDVKAGGDGRGSQLLMYVCMYVCMYVSTYVSMCMYVCVYVRCVCMYVSRNACVCASTPYTHLHSSGSIG
jgi:hypothetical protein